MTAPLPEMSDERIEEIAARLGSSSLNVTRLHELGGFTRTILDPDGLIELARAILSEGTASLKAELDDYRARLATQCGETLAARGERDALKAALATREECYAAAIEGIDGLKAERDALKAEGPSMRRGVTGEGKPWMGTMRECLEDAKQAAAVEAGLRREVEAEREALLAEHARLRAEHATLRAEFDAAGQRLAETCAQLAKTLAERKALQEQFEDAAEAAAEHQRTVVVVATQLRACERERDELRRTVVGSLHADIERQTRAAISTTPREGMT
jgi:chromosome segregation ATPase